MMKAKLITRNLKRVLVDNGDDWRPRYGWRATARMFLPNNEVRYNTATKGFVICTDGEDYFVVNGRDVI